MNGQGEYSEGRNNISNNNDNSDEHLAAESRDSRGCILLLDDDVDVLGANARFLRISGYTVIVSNNAISALIHIENESIDAAVTDLRMPEMDGLAFANKARELKPLLPLLFFSAYGSVPEVVAAMQIGAVDFLEKPVSPSLLLERIDDMCGAHSESRLQPRMAFDKSATPFRHRVLAYEKYLIETSMHKHDGHVAAVLEELKINRRTLNEKMHRLGIRRNRSDE